MPTTPIERANELVEILSYLEDKDEKLQFIIDKGKSLPSLDDEFKIDTFKIEGCQSNLWLVPEFKDARVFFRADSDAVITRGIVAVLIDVYSNGTAEEILALDPAFLAEGGITQHLTPNRRNGLANVCRKIRDYAEAGLTSKN